MRLFVAVDLDPERHEAIARATGALGRALASAGLDRAARWVPPRNLHLTMRFIGEVDEATGARVREVLGAPLDLEPFDVVFEGAGTFPPRGAPRVLWIGVARGREDLGRLFEAVEARLRPAGVPPEMRPFSAHLTVARFRDPGRDGPRGRRPSPGGARTGLAEAIAAVRVDAGLQRVGSVTLYQSRLSPAGPEYTPLVSCPLAGAARA